jgi:AcrR family transcriptional regulator
VTPRGPIRVNREARAAAAEQQRARTRERLLDAAEKVVVEKGAEAGSIEDFVKAAGVSRGTFYNYFPTTTELLHALNTRVATELDGELDRVGAAIEDPVARLAATLHTVLSAYVDDPVRGWVAVQIAVSRVPRQRAFEARFAGIYEEGVACGLFHKVDIGAAWTLAFGAVRMAQRDVLAGAAIPSSAVQVVALILAAYGVPFEQAERISCTEAAAARSR